MRSKRILIPVAAAMSLARLAGAQDTQSQDRFVITTEQVAQALISAGVAATAAQVSLPGRVVTLGHDPELDILSVHPLGKREPTQTSPVRSLVRLGCHEPHTCLPFYVTVKGIDPATATVAISSPSHTPAKAPRSDFTMPLGTRATLIMDDHRSQIQVEVISLENGMAGKWIRVASPDHKQVYRGEVVNANLLRGTF
jgi:hypothetical protein